MQRAPGQEVTGRLIGLDSGEACGSACWADKLDVLQKGSVDGGSRVSLH